MELNKKTSNEATPLLTGQVKGTSNVVERDDAITSTTPDKYSESMEADSDFFGAVELGIANVSPEKITENVEDIVQDLENLLGESSDTNYSLSRDRLVDPSCEINSSIESNEILFDEHRRVGVDDEQSRLEYNYSDVTHQASTSNSQNKEEQVPDTKIEGVSDQFVSETKATDVWKTSDNLQAATQASNENYISQVVINNDSKQGADTAEIQINEVSTDTSIVLTPTTTVLDGKVRGFSNDEFENFQSALTRNFNINNDTQFESAIQVNIGEVPTIAGIPETLTESIQVETNEIQEANEAIVLFSTEMEGAIIPLENTVSELLVTDTSSQVMDDATAEFKEDVSVSEVNTVEEISEAKIYTTNVHIGECNVTDKIEHSVEVGNHEAPNVQEYSELSEGLVVNTTAFIPGKLDPKIQNTFNMAHEIVEKTDIVISEFPALSSKIVEGDALTADSFDATVKKCTFESETEGSVDNQLSESVTNDMEINTKHEHLNNELVSSYNKESVVEDLAVERIEVKIDSLPSNSEAAATEERCTHENVDNRIVVNESIIEDSFSGKGETNIELQPCTVTNSEELETEGSSLFEDQGNERIPQHLDNESVQDIAVKQSEINIDIQRCTITNSEPLATEKSSCLLEDQSNGTVSQHLDNESTEYVAVKRNETNIDVQLNTITNSEAPGAEESSLHENQSNGVVSHHLDNETIKDATVGRSKINIEVQASFITNSQPLTTQTTILLGDQNESVVEDAAVEGSETDIDLHFGTVINNEAFATEAENQSETKSQHLDNESVENDVVGGSEVPATEECVEKVMNIDETSENGILGDNVSNLKVEEIKYTEDIVEASTELPEINLISDTSNKLQTIALSHIKDSAEVKDYVEPIDLDSTQIEPVCIEHLSNEAVSHDAESIDVGSIPESNYEENKPALESIDSNNKVDEICSNDTIVAEVIVQPQVCDRTSISDAEVPTETKSNLEIFHGVSDSSINTVNNEAVTVKCSELIDGNTETQSSFVTQLNECINIPNEPSEVVYEDLSNAAYCDQKGVSTVRNNEEIDDKQLTENSNLNVAINDLQAVPSFKLIFETETNEHDTSNIEADVEASSENVPGSIDLKMTDFGGDISDKGEGTDSEVIPIASLYNAVDDESIVTTTEMDIAVNSIMPVEQIESHVTVQLANSSNSSNYIQPNLMTESASAVEALISAELSDNAVHSNTIDYDIGFSSLPQYKSSFMTTVIPTTKSFEPSVIELNCAVASILEESSNSAISELEFAVASANDVSTSSLVHLPIDLHLGETDFVASNLTDSVQSSVAPLEPAASGTLLDLQSDSIDISEQLVTQSNIEDTPQESEGELVALKDLSTETCVPDNETEQNVLQSAELVHPLSVDVEDNFNEHRDSIVTSTQAEKSETICEITSPESQKNMSSLKITIGKDDNQHSILKIYDPKEAQSYKEEAVVPKITIKPILSPGELQHSPKLTRKPIKPPDSSNLKITIKPVLKPEPITPLKITLRPSKTTPTSPKMHTKSSEPGEISHNSPKITIKPIVKPGENSEEVGLKNSAFESERFCFKTRAKSMEECQNVSDETSCSPKLTVKPSCKSPEEDVLPTSPRITIKPIIKPSEEMHYVEERPKITIKPVKSPEECHSPKITIKPIIKPEESATSGENKHSPRITIKPVIKPDSEQSIHISRKHDDHKEESINLFPIQPLKLNIKPVFKREEFSILAENKHSPPCITIKPIVKAPESGQVSPSTLHDHFKEQSTDSCYVQPLKLNIKPVVKPYELLAFGEDTHNPPRITIKPVIQPPESGQVSPSKRDHFKEQSTDLFSVQPLKLNIKPVVKPEEFFTSGEDIPKPVIKSPESGLVSLSKLHDHFKEQSTHSYPVQPLKLNIKPVVKPEEHSTSGEDIHSPPRITIKPVVKPPESGQISPSKLHDHFKEQSTDSCSVQPLKLNIKPVIKPEEPSTSGGYKHSPPRITIKPVIKPPESGYVSPSKLLDHDHIKEQSTDSYSVQPLKLNIKSHVKPEELFTSGDDKHSPPQITFKPVIKSPESTHSYPVQPLKLNIKPVVKPEEHSTSGEDIHSPPRITIKPVVKPPESGQISPSKLYDHLKEQSTDSCSIQPRKLIIKPVVKPEELSAVEDKHSPQRITIKPLVKQPEGEQVPTPRSMLNSSKLQDDLNEESTDSHSTQPFKLNIKPVVKHPETSILQSFLKSGELPKKPMELIDFEDQIKQERIILKIAKPGRRGRPPLSQAGRVNSSKLKLGRDSQMTSKRSLSDERDQGSKYLKGDNMLGASVGSDRSYINDGTNSLESIAQHEPRLKSEEFPDPLAEIPIFEITAQSITSVSTAVLKAEPMQVTTSVASTPPMPRKRGRPRKVPLQVREEFKDPREEEVQSLPTEEPLQSLVTEEPIRPKRSCRGPSARSALGMRPRKPRGSRGSRGGGSTRGTRSKNTRKPKEPKLPIGSLNLFPEPIVTDFERTDTDVKDVEFKPVPLPTETGNNNREVVIYEEETRMSAENSSRAQTPAKQVLSSTEVVEESQSSVQSNATTESGEKIHKSRKGSRVEVHHEPEGEVLSADKLTEYSWGGGGPYMLQEQVAQFLGIKSFKRKYPGIHRRTVDMQERDFIRESCLASEAMCDMGLTAVKSEDILDIMYTDFQHKYEEYCKHQRDRQAKDVSNKQKALSLAASQEKNKLDIVEQAVQSAHQWNTNFNKTRREQRRACMDLQTFTVHYPKGKMKQINKAPIGNYPLSLVPGQYSDYYKKYSPRELSSLPLNTVGCGSNVDVEDSQSDGSGSDSNSSSSDSDSSSSGSSDDCKVCNTRSTITKKQLVR